MATVEQKFTLAEVEVMVREAGQFAYEQGKNETLVKMQQFFESLATHPSATLSVKTVARLVRNFDA